MLASLPATGLSCMQKPPEGFVCEAGTPVAYLTGNAAPAVAVLLSMLAIKTLKHSVHRLRQRPIIGHLCSCA